MVYQVYHTTSIPYIYPQAQPTGNHFFKCSISKSPVMKQKNQLVKRVGSL